MIRRYLIYNLAHVGPDWGFLPGRWRIVVSWSDQSGRISVRWEVWSESNSFREGCNCNEYKNNFCLVFFNFRCWIQNKWGRVHYFPAKWPESIYASIKFAETTFLFLSLRVRLIWKGNTNSKKECIFSTQHYIYVIFGKNYSHLDIT